MNATKSYSNDDLRLVRIQKVSKILRAIMLAFLILEGASVMAAVIVMSVTIFHLSVFKPQIVFANCKAFILLPVAFMVTLNFFQFFTRFRDGHLFDGQTVKYLEDAGKWWLALGIAQIIYQSVEAYALSPNNINITDGGGIFSGLLVVFIAWVLREGQKLKEEQELTV